MRKIIFLVSAIFTISVFSPNTVLAATLHAIIAADTLDRSIGTSVKIDIRRMQTELNNISKHSGLRLKKKVIEGRSLTRSNIEKAIKKLKVSSDDVVIFYYSGHGFRTKKKKTRWPALYLKSKKSIDFSIVTERIQKKNPRFFIAISDSCNNVIKDKHAPQFRKGSFTRTIPGSYKELFRNYRGYIFASGSVAGEFAMGNNAIGGFFTNQLLENLRFAVKTRNPDWQAIMKKSTKSMVFSGGSQNPQHETRVTQINPTTTTPVIADNTTTSTTTTTTTTTNPPVTTNSDNSNLTINGDDEENTELNDLEINDDEFSLENDPCLDILEAATNIAQAAGDILDKGKLGRGSKLYKDVVKHLKDFEQIAREDGDLAMQQRFSTLRSHLTSGRWKKASDGLFDLFGTMDKIINQQCKSLKE